MSNAADEGESMDRVPGHRRGTPLSDRDPHRLGRYTLLTVLGEGGMGRVYLGRRDDGRQVAVKVIRQAIANDVEFRRRFRNEVNRARQVPPFATAEVIDADPDHNPPYLVVEYVDGPSLADVVAREGPLTAANLHGIAVGVAAALTAIHDAGIIHRDLKPANVLLARGSPKIIDFGIAKPAIDPTVVTDGVLGTIPYMAPERFYPAERANVTPATDVFAWGAVVAFAATGRSPFSAESTGVMIDRILHGAPDVTDLPQPLRDLVYQALASDPERRPTARQLLDRLTAVRLARPTPSALAESALPTQPTPGSRRLNQRRVWWRRRRHLLAIAAILIILTVFAAVTALRPRGDGRVSGGSDLSQPSSSLAQSKSPTKRPQGTGYPYLAGDYCEEFVRAWQDGYRGRARDLSNDQVVDLVFAVEPPVNYRNEWGPGSTGAACNILDTDQGNAFVVRLFVGGETTQPGAITTASAKS